jgi:hypothetical protein
MFLEGNVNVERKRKLRAIVYNVGTFECSRNKERGYVSTFLAAQVKGKHRESEAQGDGRR